jgi:hypothetical protein
MHGVQIVVYYMLMHNLTILTPLQAIYEFAPSIFSI